MFVYDVFGPNLTNTSNELIPMLEHKHKMNSLSLSSYFLSMQFWDLKELNFLGTTALLDWKVTTIHKLGKTSFCYLKLKGYIAKLDKYSGIHDLTS